MKKNIAVMVLLSLSSTVFADYKDDIGYTQLQQDLGASIPKGVGVSVTQVEAAIAANETNVGAWMPDTGSIEFTGKSIIDQSVPVSDGISGHSTGVGSVFYGNSSMANGIIDVDVYSAADWLLSGFLRTGTNGQPLISDSRITNHSWVGAFETNSNSVSALKRVDWLVEENEFIQVTAMNNGVSNSPLLGNAYNSIAVGRTDANHVQGSLALDADYVAGRTRPDVVAPVSATSTATPVVSAAAAMLIEQANSAAQGTTTTISNGDQIYNGERSEVVKAVIMAGADRITANTSSSDQITDYRVNPAHPTANGLDSRFGAGQLNVSNNYHIMDAGEQNSIEDGGNAFVFNQGYDCDESFGGTQGSNNSASYFFETNQLESAQLTASLVWNLNVEDAVNSPGFGAVVELFNLDMFLYDVTGGSDVLLASSESDIDNSESLWYLLEQGRDYKINVLAADGDAFNWDYGLAWNISPSALPVPAAVWFFLTGVLGLAGLQNKSLRKS